MVQTKMGGFYLLVSCYRCLSFQRWRFSSHGFGLVGWVFLMDSANRDEDGDYIGVVDKTSLNDEWSWDKDWGMDGYRKILT